MKQKVNCRSALPSDAKQLAKLAMLCFSDPWSENLFRQSLLSPHCQGWCAMTEQDMAGYLLVSRTGDAWNIDDIAVHPQYRRQGIGNLLLAQLSQTVTGDFLLEVRESNAAALAFYEKNGFVQTGYRKRYYENPREGAILMTKAAKNSSNKHTSS